MSLTIVHVAQQVKGQFDWGNIQENKPVGFPQEQGGMNSFSTLFYWAHAWSEGGGEIGLHPHKGFEILSYVIKGEVQHYDTLLKKWIPLKEGDLQIIRSGSGISHAERIGPDSEIFQIWIDPGLRRTLAIPASYDDYSASDFPTEEQNGAQITSFHGEGSPLNMLGDAKFKKIVFGEGELNLDVPEDRILSVLLLEGELSTEDGQKISKGDFFRAEGTQVLAFDAISSGNLFLIEVPKVPGYDTYIN